VTTLPRQLLDNAAAMPARVAFRRKVLGIWEETTYAEYARRVSRIGAGLAQLGVRSGDGIAIVSQNRPEWLFVDIAAQGIGAAVAAVPPAAPEDDLLHVLETSDAVAAVVEDELQLDKVLAIAGALPNLRHIVVIDAPPLDGTNAVALTEVEQDAPVDALDEWEERVARLDAAAAAAIVHTAGATGSPRALAVSHTALFSAGQVVVDALGIGQRDELLSALPLSHVANRVLSGSGALHAGAAVHFGEAGPAFVIELREVQPTVFLAPPRVWEQLFAGAELGARHASRVKRAAYRFGTRRDRNRSAVGRAVAWLVVQRSIKAKLGLTRARVALSAGAAISPDVVSWFRAIGVPARESYGPAEAAGYVALKPGGVLPGVEVRVVDGDELLVRTPFAATGVAGDDGWVRTGDLGTVDGEGEITITGRRADVIALRDGTRIAPAPIEAQFKASPFVGDVVLVGDGRAHLTALIGIEAITVADWLAREGKLTASVEEMAGRRDVAELVDHAIDAVNENLQPEQRIHDFRLLPTELDEESGLRTSAYQVRRPAVIARFHELVDAMYENVAEVARP
jgi:long-chain acyl-CoA synthetase